MHCCKAHSKNQKENGKFDPCEIVAPENFILKPGTRDYVEDVTYQTVFDVNRFNGGRL